MGRSRPRSWARPVLHGFALLLALSAAALAAAALDVHPVVAAASLVALLGLTGYLVRLLAPRDQPAPAADDTKLIAEADTSPGRHAEEALAERAAELERSNAMLSEANARLATALTFKNDLTSMLTHDVAQPISSIASLSELLCADWPDLPDDIRFELASKIDKNTQRLIKMMNDLQMLFRLDTGAVTARRAPVPVLEAVRTVTAGEEDVEVEVDQDLAVLADREHVTVVVQNLVRNALAYGESPVTVEAARRDDKVVLTVRDHGPGIPEELLPKLFGRFMRGAGLGLFIVRHLVEANGGTVRYEPAQPRGARLIVTLEAAPI
jgi:signal transduction histidine kinase